MPQQAATITTLSTAFEMVKAMRADGLEWGEGNRPLGRQVVAAIIEEQMAVAVDRYLDRLGAEDAPDRRNGHCPRHLLTTLGDIELRVPRIRRYSPAGVLRAYARREAEIDRSSWPASCSECDPQDRRDAAGNAWPGDQRHYGQPSCQDAQWRGGREHGLVQALANAVGLRALGLGARVIYVLDRKMERILMPLRLPQYSPPRSVNMRMSFTSWLSSSGITGSLSRSAAVIGVLRSYSLAQATLV
jgi:Transposase, Mutator family